MLLFSQGCFDLDVSGNIATIKQYLRYGDNIIIYIIKQLLNILAIKMIQIVWTKNSFLTVK
jgi:hypothetical protein